MKVEGFDSSTKHTYNLHTNCRCVYVFFTIVIKKIPIFPLYNNYIVTCSVVQYSVFCGYKLNHACV
jgi:hypothetical protein